MMKLYDGSKICVSYLESTYCRNKSLGLVKCLVRTDYKVVYFCFVVKEIIINKILVMLKCVEKNTRIQKKKALLNKLKRI